MALPSIDVGELGDRLACLSEASASTSLAETLVAFANGGGGTILIETSPGGSVYRELADSGASLDFALRTALALDPPLIIPMPYIAEAHGTTVVVIRIPQGLPHVYSYKGKYLIRSEGRSLPLSQGQLRRLVLERGAASFESVVPDGVRLSDLDWDLVDRYLSRMDGLPATAPQEALIRRGCLAKAGDSMLPTKAGLLLFGRDPQRWVRSSAILLARYPGTEMGDRFIKEEVQGPLPAQIRKAEAFVLSNMRREVRLLGLERVEESEYPVEAVREAIVNAVAHRDYRIGGEEIRILIFRDRIEFYSPGRLPGHVTVDNLVNERFSRNEVIVQVLSDMGYIERLGYGIDRMIRTMAEEGLPAPLFEETAAGFRVTLSGRDIGFGTRESGAGRWHHAGLSDRQNAALAYLVARGRITNREFQELCPEVSSETIRRDLSDMVRKSLILKIGDKRGTYYILK